MRKSDDTLLSNFLMPREQRLTEPVRGVELRWANTVLLGIHGDIHSTTGIHD